FFQAEDGIRDRNVTGVQTCALPIWGHGWRLRSCCSLHYRSRTIRQTHRRISADSRETSSHVSQCHRFRSNGNAVNRTARHRNIRSEERRVGKECKRRRAKNEGVKGE